MASSATMNTVTEGIGKIAQDITKLMMLPGAEPALEFLTDLQVRCMGYVTQANSSSGEMFPPVGGMQAQPSPGPPPPLDPEMPPEIAALMGGGAQVSGIAPAGGPPSGMMGGPPPAAPNLAGGMPNPDEVRRLMSAG